MGTRTLELLLGAFDTVIRPTSSRPTGSRSLGYEGRFEDTEGAHWTVWIDADGAFLGVTMPGKQFRDWPIATYILRERIDPELLTLAQRLGETGIEVAWWRTVWQGTGRLPKHKDQNLTGDAYSAWVPLRSLDQKSYQTVLDEALK